MKEVMVKQKMIQQNTASFSLKKKLQKKRFDTVIKRDNKYQKF